MLCSVMKFEKSWNSWNSWKSSLKGIHFGFHLSVHLGVSFGIHLVGPTFFIYQKKQTLHCYYFRVWIKKHVLFASISHVTNYYLKGMSNIRQNLNSFVYLNFPLWCTTVQMESFSLIQLNIQLSKSFDSLRFRSV